MFRHILVPLDGSDVGEAVLPAATGLAGSLGAKLTLFVASESYAEALRETLSPSDAPGLAETGVTVARNVAESSADSAERYLERVRSRLKTEGTEAEVAVGEGPPAYAIIEFARNNDVDLIAMATHGRSGVSRAISGSVADEVLRSAEVPLLLVRAGSS